MNAIVLGTVLLFTVLVVGSNAQDSRDQCLLAGAYRIDVESSDKLYTVVKDATSRVPFGDQQRFFLDLSTRLTPPDMIAIECRGKSVSIASSRASRVTFTADGKHRRERRPGGAYVNSKVELSPETLTFTSSGKAEDNVNVSFEALDGGQRMRVVRRIMAAQLDEPLEIKTVYDKVSYSVNWDTFRNDRVAAARPRPEAAAPTRTLNGGAEGNEAGALRAALTDWIDATNRRDIARQMTYYMPQLRAYYLTRNTPVEFVREEKRRVFSTASSIDIAAEEPEIVFQDGGRTAVMRFRKKYRVVDRRRTRSGEVIQELRWQQNNGEWRIVSERDIRVLR